MRDSPVRDSNSSNYSVQVRYRPAVGQNTSLGGLRIREATTTRLDAYLEEVART
ncbi:hypothetical protein ATK86_5935 [Nocardia fluminea]|uniref:Uncharacterized protein n=1 Tax=Nocardia fluminea TaxID=134984 RepID=A0A2N3VIK6_9NOCA|nr:hypothetical protein ATK86_5935 [Nocardia fluminea]